jgi:FADH2 O2-dependent halogenase
MQNQYDVAILGSSFSGSILAAVLASQGLRVLMLDRGQHPRFAIGESSTPTADFLLEAIAKRWHLTKLLPLARWGTWQQHYPQVTAGKKRGFSYFTHSTAQPFVDTPSNSNSLLVAASASDALSDTHWLRSEVDQFLFHHAQDLGVDTFESCDLIELTRPGAWYLRWCTRSDHSTISGEAHATWLIDSTGTGGVLARAAGLQANDEQLLTQTGAIFSHFEGIASWDELQNRAGNLSTVQPFHSDDAAQHHLMHEGWMWMLRFSNGLTSVGIVQPSQYWSDKKVDAAQLQPTWDLELSRFPSIRSMFERARMRQPLRFQARLSRIWSAASGDGWAMLPTTAGFVDPLHSSGIAHALSGVYRIADMLLEETTDAEAWKQYGLDVLDEVRWIDQLVSSCYTALPDFELFCMAANFYFLSAIDAEKDFSESSQRLSLHDSSVKPPSFLSCQKRPLRNAIEQSIRELRQIKPPHGGLVSSQVRQQWLQETKERLQPWNHADLGNIAARNRFARSAANK